MIQGYSNHVFSAEPKDLGASEPRRNHSKLGVIYTYINSRGHHLMTGTEQLTPYRYQLREKSHHVVAK